MEISRQEYWRVDTEPLFEIPEPYSKFPSVIYFTHGNVSFHVTLSIHLTLAAGILIGQIFKIIIQRLHQVLKDNSNGNDDGSEGHGDRETKERKSSYLMDS